MLLIIKTKLTSKHLHKKGSTMGEYKWGGKRLGESKKYLGVKERIRARALFGSVGKLLSKNINTRKEMNRCQLFLLKLVEVGWLVFWVHQVKAMAGDQGSSFVSSFGDAIIICRKISWSFNNGLTYVLDCYFIFFILFR